MTSPAEIADRLQTHLANEIVCEVIATEDQRLGCLTPLDYPSGDGIMVWIEDRYDGLMVTDYGESLTELIGHPSQDHKALLDEATAICRRLDLEFRSGRIVTIANHEGVGDAIWRIATAAAQVAQMSVDFHPQRRHREQSFLYEIEDALRQRKLPVERERRLAGRSGHKHRASLYVPDREIIVEPVGGTGNWNQISTVYAKFGDLSRANGFRLYSVVDDREGALKDDLANLLVQVSDVIDWTRRDEWLGHFDQS
jgi:hypothetical protein